MAVNLRALRTRGLASSGPYPLPAAPTQPTGSTSPAIQSDPALQAGPAQLADALGGLMQPSAAAPAAGAGTVGVQRITAGAGTSSTLPAPTTPSSPSTPAPSPSTPKSTDNWSQDWSTAAALPMGQRYAFWLSKSHYQSGVHAAQYAGILQATKAYATSNKTPGTQTRTF